MQAALIASQNHAIETVVIPTPDASKLFADHSLYYTPDYVQPPGPSLIRFSAQIEDCTGPLYNLDDKDEAFLHSLKETPDVSLVSDTEFEELIWELEMLANERVCCHVLLTHSLTNNSNIRFHQSTAL